MIKYLLLLACADVFTTLVAFIANIIIMVPDPCTLEEV